MGELSAREYFRANMKAQRAKWIAEGKCRTCGRADERTADGKSECDPCNTARGSRARSS
jgi:hypothetical protein